VNVDKRSALNVAGNFMEDLVLAKNKLTNNLKSGSEEKTSSYVRCVKLTLKKVKDAII
jgi:predicted DNA-binding protein